MPNKLEKKHICVQENNNNISIKLCFFIRLYIFVFEYKKWKKILITIWT
jgi:hypothetical protein